ncbi:MAG: ferredoxin [Actinomycetota bacterium]|nr:ferredoxin [Actinomycetota bacterium]
MHVHVNLEKCCGYALCAEVCPEVFTINNDGFAEAVHSAVPPELEAKAGAGAAACPAKAIVVTDSEPAQSL